jgi:hypothetical protein
MKVARVIASREKWKATAIDRGSRLRRANRRLGAVEGRNRSISTRLAQLEAENAALLQARDAAARAPAPISSPPSRNEVRVVVVLVFAIGLIPCNALARCFEVLCRAGWLAVTSIPHPSSVVNWVARAGLGRLMSVGRVAFPWVAIIDSSISYGKAKMLVILRVPLAHFALGKGAVGLADVECVGLSVRESWSGEDVKEQLLRTFDVAGLPAAIVKDQGADIKRGVDLLRREQKGIVVIRDVGHVFALLLKREYEKNPVFVRFLKLIDSARARLCHSDLAALRPPKIRAKGRFQGISRVVDWATRMAELLSGSGRPTKGSLRERLSRAMPKLCAMRFFFTRFSRDCTALNAVMELLKTQGLNQETYKAAVALLEPLPARSRMKGAARAWLDETLRTHCRLGIGQTPLVVSSDVIESLYGIEKMILERSPAPEFGTLSLATPLFCGNLTEHVVREAMERCPHDRLTEWKSANLAHTKRRVQSRLLNEVRRKPGQDREPAASA